MVACAVHVPLALAALLPRAMSEEEERVWTALCRLWLPAAMGLLISFLLDPGTGAVIAASPWFLFAALAGGFGAEFTWRRRRRGPWSEVLIGFASVYFAGSAVWLLAHRGGWTLLGHAEPWVLWTTAHFLVYGTTTLVVAGVLGRCFPDRPRHRVMATLLVFGMPLTAGGIQTGAVALERAGAWVTIAGGAWLAIEMLVQRYTLYGWRRKALDIGGLSLLGGMGLALAFTLNMMLEWGWPSYDVMATWHAGLNTAFGVAALLALGTRPGGTGDRPGF